MKKLLLTLVCLLAFVTSWAVTINGADITGFGNGTNYTSGSWEQENIKISCTSGFSTTQFRVGKKATLTIETTDGSLINEIVFTASGGGYKLNADNISWNGTTGTYTANTPSSTVEFTNSNDNIARITNIEINLIPAGGVSISKPVFGTESGIVAAGTTVALTCSTAGASIYYATEAELGNADPTAAEIKAANHKGSSFTVNATNTYFAVATTDGENFSGIATASYAIPAHAGTVEDPFSVADAIAIAKAIGATATEEIYYVEGYVTKVVDAGSTFKNATWEIADVKNATEDLLTVYRCKGVDGADLEGNEVSVGDKIVVKGKIVNYKNETPEVTNGELVSGASVVNPTLPTPTATFPAETYTFDCGIARNFYGPAVETNSDGEVIYTITPAMGAEMDGTVVMIDDAGTYTVTAHIAETANFKEATATYTIVATNSLNYTLGETMEPETFDFTDDGAFGMTAESGSQATYPDKNKIIELSDLVSMTFEGGCRLFNSNDVYTFRVNKNFAVTLIAADGYVITGVEIDYANKNYLTVGDMPAKIVNLTNNASGTSQIKSIVVTCAKEVATQTITVGDSGIATFCTRNALDFTGVEAVKAYVATEVDDETVVLDSVEGVVPGNIGLVIMGTTADVPVVVSTTEEISVNLLKPAFGGFAIPTSAAGVNRYVYGKLAGETESAFHLLATTNDLVSKANRAYLEVMNSTPAGAPKRLKIATNDTTGIENIAVDAAEEAIYNVYGQRVNNDYKGVVISKGKKVINK